MSKDIRSFFSVVSKKPNSSKPAINTKKRPVISSDDDIIEASPVPVKNKINNKLKKRKIVDSDSDDENKKPRINKSDIKKNNDKIKKVSAADVFGSTPVIQSKVEKEASVSTTNTTQTSITSKTVSKSKPQLETELGIHDDPDFEQSLLDLDNDLLLDNVSVLDKTIEEALNNTNTSMSSYKNEIFTSKTKQKRKLEEDEDTDIDKDQERYEKKRHSAVLYQKYLNRAGPVNHGKKEYPKGKPNCLRGLCFLRTGVLDSLAGEEFDALVSEYGGRTVHAISRKVNYVVVGVEAGPAKLEKANKYGIANISEDEFLDLILTKSGMSRKYAVQSSEDNAEEQKPSSSSRKEEIKITSPKNKPPITKETANKKSPEKKDKPQELKKPNLKKLSDDIKQENIKVDDKEKKDIKSESTKIKDEIIKQKDSRDNVIKIEKSSTKIKNENAEKKDSGDNVIKTEKNNTKIKNENLEKKDSDANVIKIEKNSFYGKKDTKAIDEEKQIGIADRKKESVMPSDKNMSWADKYKPKDIKSIIGQQGEKSNMKKLLFWLSNWHHNHAGKKKLKMEKATPWAKRDDGASFKCALLSGSPGIGKTTTATLVAKELGYDIVEFNASDTRSKKLLHEEVSQLLSSNSITSFMKDGSAPTKKHVLLMDEVDGMAGNEDRGGMQELIALIKNSNVPIICMCNDRNHPKMRSLVNYCFDLRFSKPRLEQIRGAMMSVCFKEGLKMSPEALSQIISGTDMDVRQTLNHLSMWTVDNKNLSAEEAKREAAAAKKDTTLGPWEVIRKVFTEDEQKTMSVADKFRLFFYDYSIGPLFVQENYLQVQPHCQKRDWLQRAADAADAISTSDLIDKKMRSSNNWSLLEVQAIFSSVLPGHYMSGHFKGPINFPSWLGKNSRKTKIKRLISELQAHTRISTSASRKSVNLDYIYHWRDNIVRPLRDKRNEGIEEALNVMHSYNLLRQDLDGILEVSHWTRQKDAMAMVDSKVKTAFTKAYNKDNAKLPYAVPSAATKKKATAALENNPYDEEEIDSSPEEDDDITKDAMIKAKKPAKAKTTTSEASTSKKASSSKKPSSKGDGKGKGSKKTK